MAGAEVVTREYTGTDPIGFVLSANLHRRHLDESQRAWLGGGLTALELGANQHTKGQGSSISRSLKTPQRRPCLIERAREVLKSGDTPNLIRASRARPDIGESNAADQVTMKKT